MRKQKPEQQIKNSILAWLKIKGIFAWPNDSVGVYDPVKKIYRMRHSKFKLNGVSDILGIYSTTFLAIECKAPKGRLSKEQREFLEMVRDLGGIAIVARSIEDVEQGLLDFNTNKLEKRGFA